MHFEIFIALNFTGMEFHYLGPSNILLVPKGCTSTTDIRVKAITISCDSVVNACSRSKFHDRTEKQGRQCFTGNVIIQVKMILLLGADYFKEFCQIGYAIAPLRSFFKRQSQCTYKSFVLFPNNFLLPFFFFFHAV